MLPKKDIFRCLEFMLLRDGDINETTRMRDGYINEDVSHGINRTVIRIKKGFVVVTCYMLDTTKWMFLKLIFFKSSSISSSEVMTTDNIVVTRWSILAHQPRINIEQ